MNRLYVVVDGTLPPGDQVSQACHAVSAFAHEHRSLHAAWQSCGRNIVVLSAATEAALLDKLRTIADGAVPCSTVREPDLNDRLTAFACSEDARKLLSTLPLALRRAKAA